MKGLEKHNYTSASCLECIHDKPDSVHAA